MTRRAFMPPAKGNGLPTKPATRARAGLPGAGRSLDPALRDDMEQRFGADFEDVRIHTDRDAEASASALHAKAYTVGRDIAFSDGRFAPGTREGKQLLAHELAHVVQQTRGGAGPRGDASDAALENGADAAASQVTSGEGAVAVAGASGVGIARQDDDEREAQKPESVLEELERKGHQCGSHHRPADKTDWRMSSGMNMPKFVWKKPAKDEEPPDPRAHTGPVQFKWIDPKALPPWVEADDAEISPELVEALNRREDKPKEPLPKFELTEESHLDPLLDRPTAERKLREEHANWELMFPGLAERFHGDDPTYWRAMGKYRPSKPVPLPFVPPSDPSAPPPLVFKSEPWNPTLGRDMIVDNPDYWKTPRGKFRRTLGDDIKALRSLYDSLRGQRADVVGGSTVFRKVGENMAGDIDPPPIQDLRHAYALLDEADTALARDDVERAQQKYAEAQALKDKVSWEWGHYSGFLEYGLNREAESLEQVRDTAKYSLAVLSMGGGAAVMWAGALGAIAIEATDKVGQAALGEPVDWSEFAVDVVVQVILTKFGGNVSRGLLGKLEAAGIKNVSRSVIAEALANGMVMRAVTQIIDKELKGKDLTWEQVIDHVFDPGSMAFDAVLGVVTARMQKKPGVEEPIPGKQPTSPPKKKTETTATGAPPTAATSPMPISRAKGRRGPPTQLKGQPGTTPPIPIGRAKRARPPETPPRAHEQPIPQEKPLQKAAGGYENVAQPKVAGDRTVASAGTGRRTPRTPPTQAAKGNVTALADRRGRNAPPPRTPTVGQKPEAPLDTTIADAPNVLPDNQLVNMNKAQRHRYVKDNFPKATDLAWTRSPDTQKLNSEGIIVLRVEPGMLGNDVRRKASALGSVASQGRMAKQGTLPPRKEARNTYDPKGPPVKLSREYRNKLIDQTHKQAAAGNWDEKRKFAVIRRILISEGDHVVDLQLGGSDDLNNLWVVDAYTNERLGAQILAQLRNMPVGTRIKDVRGSPQ